MEDRKQRETDKAGVRGRIYISKAYPFVLLPSWLPPNTIRPCILPWMNLLMKTKPSGSSHFPQTQWGGYQLFNTWAFWGHISNSNQVNINDSCLNQIFLSLWKFIFSTFIVSIFICLYLGLSKSFSFLISVCLCDVHVCMLLYMCYTCVYVCACSCVYGISVCAYAYMFLYKWYTYVHLHACIFLYMWCTCMSVSMHVHIWCTYLYAHVCIHAHFYVCGTCVHMFLYMVYVSVCLCMYGGQRTTLDAVLSWVPSTLVFVRESFSQDLELAHYARLACQEPQGSIFLWIPVLRLQGWAKKPDFLLGFWGSNLGLPQALY